MTVIIVMIIVVVMAQHINTSVFCVVAPCPLPHASEDCGFIIQHTENLTSKKGNTMIIAIWTMLTITTH
jgi:hypothetical protein